MDSRKILVVDDDEKVRKLLEMSLKGAGFTVLSSETAEGGLEILKNEPGILVFFLDLRLPNISGIDMCRKIKEARPTAILHAVTGYTSVYDLVECRAAGFEDYFIKPFKVSDIIQAAENAFAKITKWRQEHPDTY